MERSWDSNCHLWFVVHSTFFVSLRSALSYVNLFLGVYPQAGISNRPAKY
jgi:hypothetical protein